jgi:hypothetical protein
MKKLKKCSSRSTRKKQRRVLGIPRAVFTASFEKHSDSKVNLEFTKRNRYKPTNPPSGKGDT